MIPVEDCQRMGPIAKDLQGVGSGFWASGGFKKMVHLHS